MSRRMSKEVAELQAAGLAETLVETRLSHAPVEWPLISVNNPWRHAEIKIEASASYLVLLWL
jgi:hypothetical protein